MMSMVVSAFSLGQNMSLIHGQDWHLSKVVLVDMKTSPREEVSNEIIIIKFYSFLHSDKNYDWSFLC